MRKLYGSIKYKQYSRKRARKELKARSRFASYLHQKEIKKIGKSLINYRHRRDWKVDVVAPRDFSVRTNPEKVIRFINRIEACLESKKSVFIVMKNVESIDYGSIAVLFSIMELFQIKGIPFNGDMPLNEEANMKLHDSKFFDELYKNKHKVHKFEPQQRTDGNRLFKRTERKVEPQLGLQVMIQASTALWGEKKLCKGLQRILLELMHNTNNHAGGTGKQGDERWCISVNHNRKENKVEFVFVDYGVGIFNSLQHKPKGNKWYGWKDKLKRVTGGGDSMFTNELILQKLLQGEIHASVTGQSFRGKGLPGIKQVADRNQVSNLFVLSNNAYADTGNNKYLLLNNDFSGTFVYWELCYSNENKLWTVR